MRTKNILGGQSSVKFNLSQVYWLCKEKEFYTEGIKILRAKNFYDHAFWSYSIMHKDLTVMKEYLNSNFMNAKAKLGPDFNSTLCKVNQREESHDLFAFLDYFPLVNARAHRIGGMSTQASSRS